MKKKNFLKLIVMGSLVFSLVACSDEPVSNNENDDQVVEGSGEVQYQTVADVVAQYVEKVDNQSIKLILDGNPATLRLSAEIEVDLIGVEANDEVRITYTIETKQVSNGEIKTMYLDSLEKVEEESVGVELSTEKEMEVLIEGEPQNKTAVIMKNKMQNFTFYLLEGFEFSLTGDEKALISSTMDSNFTLEIGKLGILTPEKFELKIGKKYEGIYTKLDPQEIDDDSFKDSELYLLVETGDLSLPSRKTNTIYVIKEIDGELMTFIFTIPLKESTEGISPHLWAMAKTVELK